MRNIKLTIEYDGTNYAGWQRQKNSVSIQEKIEKAIFDITKENVDLISSGRTDSGVHALGQVANFMTNAKVPIEKFARAINAKLPKDIVIVDAEEVSLDFHSRFSAKRKRYKYVILNRKYDSPIHRNHAYRINYDLDFEKMEMEAKSFLGEHDFKGFMSTGSSFRSTIRTIYDIEIKQNEEFITLEIEGNAFLYNMVRIIAGTLIDIGRGRIKENLIDIIDSTDRKRAGQTAPATGLFLKKVYY